MCISKFSVLAILSASSLVAAASASAASNSAPKISGTPAVTTITQPTYFSFQPAATDADGNRLKFSIQNMPAWGTFDPWSGLFRGWVSKWYEGREFANIVISVSDGQTTASLKPFTVKYTTGKPAVTNTAPMIAGSPAAGATVGQAYTFQPSAKDAQGDALAFSIQNKPSWASFSTATGALTGTPSAAGTAGSITVSVSDGKASASLAAFSIQIAAAASTNHAPTIAGSAKGSLQVGETYAFQPNAADADGDALTFSVQNKPAWSSFDTKTGSLTGSPTAADVGTFSNVSISVSDGKSASALSAFAITVTQVSMGAATVNWTPPTQNTDGSTLANLAGYRIMYGTSAGKYTQMVEIKNAGITSAMIENLSPATYYFAVKVFTTQGTESELSNSVSKVIN